MLAQYDGELVEACFLGMGLPLILLNFVKLLIAV